MQIAYTEGVVVDEHSARCDLCVFYCIIMHLFSESHLWLWYMQKLICCRASYCESSDLLQAIPSHSARRSLFEHYVKTRAEEKRKEKRAAQKAAVEGFKQLLEEASEVS